MAVKWTSEQKQAIENRGGTLLVSAAAGSGKTAVLVERVLRRVQDEKAPADIDRFLIVTYTNAAAAELRGKIADALSARVAAAPDDARLRRQLVLLHRAQITTVHSFCLSLVREYFMQLGLTPDFRIADENENKILMDEVLDELLEEAYEREDAGFLALSDLLSAGRDDKRLHSVILETYGKIQSHPDPAAFLQKVAHSYQIEAGKGYAKEHIAVLLKEAEEAALYGMACLGRAIEQMQEDDILREAYLPAFLSDYRQAEAIADTAQAGNWDGAVTLAREIGHDRLGNTRKYEDKAHLEALKALREQWKDAAKKIAGSYLCIDSQGAGEDRVRMAPALCALTEMVLEFTERFAAAKKKRATVDFNDLEHFALGLLTGEAGKNAQIAQTVSSRFDEVLVDEYQDTNAVQDAIFHAVSDESRKLFMVGDVKQSIYSFRLANPYIFLGKYLGYCDAGGAKAGEARRVILSKNFRSRHGILHAVNDIFARVMSPAVGDLAYDEREMLYPGAAYPPLDTSACETEVCAINTASDAEGQEYDKTQEEARYIAGRIKQMIAEGYPVFDKELERVRPVAPSDCTILLRSVKSKAAVFQKALEEAGLASHAQDSGGLLETTEVRAMVSLLSIVDNPQQDIELIAALRSPMLGFDEQLLADIRLHDLKASFYDALVSYAQENAQCARFVQQLGDWRQLAADLPVYQLIAHLYDETGAVSIYGAMPAGSLRQSNLLAFYERARAYEEKGHKGLFRFMHLIRGMLANEEDFPAPRQEGDGGAVRILSIHKSKGLEFPVVFLADCFKSFNETDLRVPILVHESLGFGAKCRDNERGIQYPSVQRLAIAARARREQISEEMRILYVGLTRAKEKMIITCASGRLISTLQKWALDAQEGDIASYAMGLSRNYARWLLTPLLKHSDAGILREKAELDLQPDNRMQSRIAFHWIDAAEQTQEKVQREEEAKEMSIPPRTAPEITYEKAYLSSIPAKITATSVKNSFKHEEAAEFTPQSFHAEKALRRPFFDREEKKLTPAEVGTAHHLFMQFCDFSACEQEGGIEKERMRLKEKRILSPTDAGAIDEKKIQGFFRSDLYRKLFQQHKVHREFKFSVLAPAGQFFEEAKADSEETVLLQGVIDCLVESPEGFYIVDFKTDRVNTQTAGKRAQEYEAQLSAYAFAVEQIFRRPVCGKIIYFFHSQQVYEI